MTDIVDKKTRSRMMSSIRGKDTKPEILVRQELHRRGLRFRLQGKLPGRPDLVFPRFRAAIFVHGCFWHRHADCRYTTSPSTNEVFWSQKFARTMERDAENLRELKALGWRTAIIWECATKKSARAVGDVTEAWIRSELQHLEVEISMPVP